MVPCFHWHPLSTCRPLRPREVHRLLAPSSFTDNAGLRLRRTSRHFRNSPPSDSRGAVVFEVYLRFALATTCRFARPPVGADRSFPPADEDFYFRAFGELVTRSAAGYDYRGKLGKFHGRDFHPLACQLASLHPTFPPLPLKSRKASFPRYGFKADRSGGAFPATQSSRHTVCIRPSCTPLSVTSDPRSKSRDAVRWYTIVQATLAALPQGPSLRSGL